MPSSPPAAWYADPEHPSKYRYWDGQQWIEQRAEQWRLPKPRGEVELPRDWAFLVTAFVMVPVTSRVSRAAVDAGVSHWAIAAVAAAIAVTAFVLLNRAGWAMHGVRDGVLLGVYLTFILTAIYAIAKALDVSEVWVMIAVVVPMLAVAWWRKRHGEKSPA